MTEKHDQNLPPPQFVEEEVGDAGKRQAWLYMLSSSLGWNGMGSSSLLDVEAQDGSGMRACVGFLGVLILDSCHQGDGLPTLPSLYLGWALGRIYWAAKRCLC